MKLAQITTTMVSIDLDELLQYTKRVEGKTVVLTGGANGIGRETAILFARYGAKVVIGDVNGEAASKVVKEIRELGGNAIYVPCNVLQWEDQIALFESAVSHFGSVDVVIPCAGVSEHGDTCSGVLDYKDGKPLPPDMSTLEINLFGAVHTVHLGLNYLRSTRTGADQWKALILIGSMASWEAIPLTPMYTSSKFAIRGLMRSLYPLVEHDNIRIACVDPVWADTPILSLTARLVLTGSELLPATRVAQTVLYAATDPDPATSGCSWLLPDNGPIMRLERENIREGTYGVINDRIARFKTIARDSKLASRRIGGNLGKVMVFAGLTGVTLVWLRFGALA
ncbi:NAD(P)-binding protein [Mycena galopus ATCC 62051]|nr:NAD(P)-binding protein [Mycena galopus ATCC 62051]